MSYPITPDPSIHTVPPAIAKQQKAQVAAEVQASAKRMIDGLVNAILYKLTGGLLGSKPGEAQKTPSSQAPSYLSSFYNTAVVNPVSPRRTPRVSHSHVAVAVASVNSNLVVNGDFSNSVSVADESGFAWDSLTGRTSLGSAKCLGNGTTKTLLSNPIEVFGPSYTVTVSGAPTGGYFTLSVGSYNTSNIAYNASPATVQAALVALASVGSGNATVTGDDGGPYYVVFGASVTDYLDVKSDSALTVPTATPALPAAGVSVGTVAGDQLSAGGYVQWSGVTATAGAAFTLSIAAYLNGVLQTITPIATWPGSGTVASSGSWTELAGNYTVPAGVDTVYLEIMVNSVVTDGSVWWDDLRLSKTGTISGHLVGGLNSGNNTGNTIVTDMQKAYDNLVNGFNGLVTGITGGFFKSSDDVQNAAKGSAVSISQLRTDVNALKTTTTNATNSGNSGFIDFTTAAALPNQLSVTYYNTGTHTLVVDNTYYATGANFNNGTGDRLYRAQFESAIISLGVPAPTAGTLLLTFTANTGSVQTTSSIAYNATTATVQTALAALSNIGAGNVTVTGSTGGPYYVNIADSVTPGTFSCDASSLTGGTVSISQSSTITNYQNVSCIFSSTPTSNSASYVGASYIFGRMNDSASSFIYAMLKSNSCEIGCVVSNVTTVLGTSSSFTFAAGATYSLICGTTGGARVFQILQNTYPVFTVTESGTTSALGSSYRYAGFGGYSTVSTAGGARRSTPAGYAASVAAFSFVDNQPQTQVGSGWRQYRTSTTTGTVSSGNNLFSAGWFDTLQYATPDVTYNLAANSVTVSIAGWYEICVNVNTNNSAIGAGTGGVMSAAIFRNGSCAQISGGTTSNINSGMQNSSATFVIYLNANDVIQPGYSSTWNAGSVLVGEATGVKAYWSGALLNRSLN